jgi:hypothetical protein
MDISVIDLDRGKTRPAVFESNARPDRQGERLRIGCSQQGTPHLSC